MVFNLHENTFYNNMWQQKLAWQTCDPLILCLHYLTLLENCPNSKFCCSAFSCIQTEYGEIFHISPYSVQMREYTDQKNSEYGHFSRSVNLQFRSYSLQCVQLVLVISDKILPKRILTKVNFSNFLCAYSIVFYNIKVFEIITFTFSKSRIETPELCVKSVQSLR